MEKKLQIACAPIDRAKAEAVASSLRKDGFEVALIGKEIDPKLVTLVVLTGDTTKDALYEACPWLEQQFESSSYRGWRLMPFFPYHGAFLEGEKEFEDKVNDLYEEIFSGEFKPYGWALDDPKTIEEFRFVLEDGYEE